MEDLLRGEKFYQDKNVAENYDGKRFGSQGGKYILRTERSIYMDLLGDLEGKKVLDVATGTGRLAIDMAERGAEVTATDISEEMIEEAREKAEEKNLEIEFFQSDAENIDLPDDSFDIVTAQRFLHLVPDHQPYVEEMARLATEKILYDYFNTWSLRLLYDWALPMGSYLHRPGKVRETLKEEGLKNVEERQHFFFPYGAIRGSSGPHISLMTKINDISAKTPVLKKFNSIIYVKADV